MDKYDLEEMYEFLDDLRDLGIVNMFASPAYLQEVFPMSATEATTVVRQWMDTYQARNGGHFNIVPLDTGSTKHAEDEDND